MAGNIKDPLVPVCQLHMSLSFKQFWGIKYYSLHVATCWVHVKEWRNGRPLTSVWSFTKLYENITFISGYIIYSMVRTGQDNGWLFELCTYHVCINVVPYYIRIWHLIQCRLPMYVLSLMLWLVNSLSCCIMWSYNILIW